MLLLNLIALTLISAQEFAFNLEAIGKPAHVGGARKEQHKLIQTANNNEIHQTSVHKFPQSSFRSYKVIGEGRFRTFKQTTGDVKQHREELVFLAPPNSVPATGTTPAAGAAESETTIDELVIEIVEPEEQGVLETIVENVRNAFDEYVAPILGNNINSETIGDAARSALDWISQRIWGLKTTGKKISNRLAIVKIDANTGDAMFIKSAHMNVQVIRIDKIVYDASLQSLAQTTGIDVGMFSFEVGDLVLLGSKKFFEGLTQEKIVKALSIENKTLGAKADALVKVAPKSNEDESFLLSIFE